MLYWQYFFTPPGGWGNRRSYDFARYWRASGHEVWILSGGTYFPPSYQHAKRAFRTPEGIPIVWLPAPYHQRQKIFGRIWAFLRFTFWSLYILRRLRTRKLYLIATLPPPFLPMIGALRRVLTGERFSIEVFDAWPQVLSAKLPPFLYAPLGLFMNWSFRQADVLFALSPDIAKYLPAAHTRISYNGTRPELFRRRKTAPFLPFRVIYAGTLGWINHLSFLVEVAELLQSYRGIEFWILGDGAERTLIMRKAHSLRSVKFFEPVPVESVPDWLSECHIGISLVRPVAILSSNSANKFYDYLANGLVIGLNYGGWQAEVLRSVQCGFSASSVHSFAAGILRYYWDRESWERASARARLWATAHYNRKELSEQVVAAIEGKVGR
ncbi:MAG: glycosyltransferase family 4 protein [Bacteroidia bacterium]|nr:glycosyltransferase family 4 protein [Bacteroidia bacterium]